MDLLGSILNAMDKPPAINEKQKEVIKSESHKLFCHTSHPENVIVLAAPRHTNRKQ